MSVSASQLSGTIADRYVIERELGHGATSNVFLARDLELGRMVALKVLRQELVESLAADRFLREIKVTAQLQHPNILPVLGSGVFANRLYFALPYMDGGTLRDKLTREKQLPIDEVVQLGVTIATALAFAHERNLIHRDVKPENILFTNGQAVLSDFGIARAITRAAGEGSTTTTGLVRGTPAYMSPEQASGEQEYDGRSDIYSLACVLYEGLAGVPAFIGATSHSIASQRISHRPRPISVFRPSVSPSLEAVLTKALETAAADRYQSASAFANALRTSDATPSSGLDISSRRRWRTRSIAVGIVALLGLASVPVARRSLTLSSPIQLDTTRLAVLPPPDADSTDARAAALIGEALRRWRPLSVVEQFEVADAARRNGEKNDVKALAQSVAAGRFVRAHVTRTGAEARIDGSINDARSGGVIHATHLVVPADSASVGSTYRRLVDSLLLRGQQPATPLDTAELSGSLPATQLMIAAQASLRDWDLPAAESLYARALQIDPNATRAALWLAQVRLWQRGPIEAWGALARQAAANADQLGSAEKEIAAALSQLADRDYASACSRYRQMIQRNERSFIAWYGLAVCLDEDDVVVPGAGPNQWRFRSSYNEAVNAYVRAFALQPSVYRSYQGDAFDGLRRILKTSPRHLRVGRSSDTPAKLFAARAVLNADTLLLMPQPLDRIQSGANIADAQAADLAVRRNRALFRQIASGWAATFPDSPGPKEALAVSLETDGDPAAIDSVRSLLRIVADPTTRLRLLASLAWLDLKFGAVDATPQLSAARQLADSALRLTWSGEGRQPAFLSRLAVVAGRCDLVARYVSAGAVPSRQLITVPQRVVGESDVRTALSAMACPIPSAVPTLDAIVRNAGISDQPPNVREPVQLFLLSRIVRFADSLDMKWATLFAPRDQLIAARLFAARGLADSARRRLAAMGARRAAGEGTPDVVYGEARAYFAINDTLGARHLLDGMFSNSRALASFEASAQGPDAVVILASFIRSMELRARVAETPSARAHWTRAFASVWTSDPRSFPVEKVLP